MKDLRVEESSIPGLYIVDLVLHGDERGWFKENYHKAKLEALGLPAFDIVQNNFSFNAETGVTRGMHAEPWEKFISLAGGKVFGAWIDLRAGAGFGKVFTHVITPDTAIFVPRGVANGYQTLEPNITYTYLVNDHWSPDAKYVSLSLFDPDTNIGWPIGRDKAIVSKKDQANPSLKDIEAVEF
ncbi:MAG TPA: dTDP-4-dehydrorhamnose 3,5-epimerase family protein [Candidatus Saccharimonadales bacterium]|nr:dTDP-4-dehydrorhamnose 3,5-epimerase family protein [Candidatus Saccharimonadales bacterium]